MLETGRLFWALAVVTAVGAAVNCGDDSATGSGGNKGGGGQASTSSASSGGGGSGGATTGGGGSGGNACPTHQGTTLAISQLFFGAGNNGEWKQLGFNIDGLNSTATSTDTCQPAAGGSPIADGDNGNDNSFGQ